MRININNFILVLHESFEKREKTEQFLFVANWSH